jgi:hypothetical protein
MPSLALPSIQIRRLIERFAGTLCSSPPLRSLRSPSLSLSVSSLFLHIDSQDQSIFFRFRHWSFIVHLSVPLTLFTDPDQLQSLAVTAYSCSTSFELTSQSKFFQLLHSLSLSIINRIEFGYIKHGRSPATTITGYSIIASRYCFSSAYNQPPAVHSSLAYRIFSESTA